MYGSFPYIFVYVPVTGRITPATARNRLGLLPAHSPSGGGQVRARGGWLQRRSASFPCGTSATEAGAQGQDRAFPEQERLQPSPLAIGDGPQR